MPLFVRPSAMALHLALALGELGERPSTGRGEQARHDLRVERRPSEATVPRPKELLDVEHAVLQQVAETSAAHKFDCVSRFDVLGEDEHADLRMRRLDLARRAPLVGEAGRHPDVDDHEIGTVAGHGGAARLASAMDATTSCPASMKSRASPRSRAGPRRSRPHGSSAVSVVPAPSSLRMSSIPPWAAIRSAGP